MQRRVCRLLVSALAVVAFAPTASAGFLDDITPPGLPKPSEVARKMQETARKVGDKVRKDIKKVGKKLKSVGQQAIKGLADLARRAGDLFRKGLGMPVQIIRQVIGLVRCLGGAARKMLRPGGGPPMRAMVTMAKDVVGDLLKFAKQETLDLFRSNADDVRVLNVKGTFGKYVTRMGQLARRTPVGACFFNFAEPLVRAATPKVEALASFVIPQLRSVWKNVLEPKVQGLIKHAITQALAVVAGDEAERILAEQVVKHIFDLDRIKAGAEKVGALAEAISSSQNVEGAAADVREALAPKDFSRARFVFDVFAAIARFKILDFVGRGCSGKEFGKGGSDGDDGNKVGSQGWFKDEGMSWFKQPGMMANKGVAALEARIPGGACLLDYGFKTLETLLTTARSAMDAVCNAGADAVSTALIAAYGAGAATLAARIAGGVTAACGLVLNFVEELVRGTVLPAMKAQAQGLITTVVTKIVDKGTELVRSKLSGVFDKVDDGIKRVVRKTGEFGRFVQRMLDGALLAFIDSRAQRFQDVLRRYDARLLELTQAAVGQKGGK